MTMHVVRHGLVHAVDCNRAANRQPG